MRNMKKLLAVCLAALFLALTAIPSLAAEPKVYSEEFFWDKAGEDADNGYKAYSIPYGSPLKIPEDPQRWGCTFLGWKDWYTDAFVDLSTQIMDAPGRRFYAAWETVTYTSRFYVFGTLWTTVENVPGEPFIHPRLPMVDGYTFAGWNPKLPQTAPAEALSFNAVFEGNTYIATLLVDGTVFAQIPYTYGQKSIDLPKLPEKPGYTGAWEPYTLGIGGVTIRAIYTPVKYIATLIVDGEVYMEIPYTYGQKSVALPQVPKKEGYVGMWGPYSLVIGGTKIEAIYSPLDNTAKTVGGDADGNGSVDAKDLVLLTRTLAGGWDARICAANLDVNGDGAINLKDVVLIRRYLAGGWGVELA